MRAIHRHNTADDGRPPADPDGGRTYRLTADDDADTDHRRWAHTVVEALVQYCHTGSDRPGAWAADWWGLRATVVYEEAGVVEAVVRVHPGRNLAVFTKSTLEGYPTAVAGCELLRRLCGIRIVVGQVPLRAADCPICEGEGGWTGVEPGPPLITGSGFGDAAPSEVDVTCHTCHGEGEIR